MLASKLLASEELEICSFFVPGTNAQGILTIE